MSAHGGPADWWTDGTDEGRTHIATKGIVQTGLVLNLDAGVNASYPDSGTTWTDLSGNGNSGTLVNGVGYSGDNGGALVFDGVNDYVSFISEPDLNNKSFSVGCWYKTLDNNMRLIQNCDTGSYGSKNGFQISVTSSHFGNTAVTDNNGNFVRFENVPSTPYIDGNWHFICLTFDTTIGKAELYLDGNFASSSVNTGLIGANANGVGLTLGIANDLRQELNGSISNAFLYDRALTDEQVKQNFNASRGRFGI